jgi:hypothetical protein
MKEQELHAARFIVADDVTVLQPWHHELLMTKGYFMIARPRLHPIASLNRSAA